MQWEEAESITEKSVIHLILLLQTQEGKLMCLCQINVAEDKNYKEFNKKLTFKKTANNFKIHF